MSDWLPLREVALRARASAGPEARHARFRARAGVWHAAFAAQTGTHWALHCDDVLEFAAALFGAWHAGKTVWLPGDALPQTRAALQPQVAGFAGDAPGDLAPAPDALDAALPGDPLDEDATRLVVFTSGTSGEASAIPKRLAQLAREVESLEATFGARLGAAPVHATVSHQHIYGLLFRVLWPLAAGREIVPRRVLFHEDMFAALQRAPGVLVSSPAHLKRLPEGLDWPRLRGCVGAVFSSGGALPDEAARDVQARFGQAPIEIYGSSETGGVAWRGDGGAWQALPHVEWRVRDARLEVRSPHLHDTDWFATEDRAQADATGFRLLGRADRIVKIEERRVSLTALERALRDTGWLQEARVLLLDGARSVLGAVCVPAAEGRARLGRSGKAEVCRALRAVLARGHDPVALPRRWRFVDALPVNAQGKTTDRDLLALFRPHAPTPRWLRRDAVHAALEFNTTPDLLVFDGHFPAAPVLPGVVQVDWAVRWAREAFALPPDFVRMEAIKFQRIVGASQRVRLSLDWSAERGTLTFAFRSESGPHASGRLVFGGAA
ncbi:AMP-binding protein [Chiayiivirga flava]|uniref:Acyl-CoA synthetase (AMP-forming)/AMP-acid ligase II n=1 Tax=Chiayiivirga flava TaxID=659595 RepID=A0A7W8D2N7_9GAMM|nr:AMP-binding protein [Chiayiivirga flava]MBB5206779.1 acyl-CoA synthetase (AMP-forming)/AMP-acid ligase II [Chiayiivirga flava]